VECVLVQTNDEQVERGRGLHQALVDVSLACETVHRNNLTTIPIMVRIGWRESDRPLVVLVSAIDPQDVAIVLLDVTSKNAGSWSANPVDESSETQKGNFDSFCQTAGLLHHDTALTSPSKSGGVVSLGYQHLGTTRTRWRRSVWE